jgi:hypothetical protein
MPLRSNKGIGDIFWGILILTGIALSDLSHFLPLADRANLRFQATGEVLELMAIALIASLVRIFGKQRGDSLTFPASLRSRMLLAGFFAMILLAVFWRDFFPNDTFSLSTGVIDFLYAPLAGVGLIVIAPIFATQREKPSKEEERSVV